MLPPAPLRVRITPRSREKVSCIEFKRTEFIRYYLTNHSLWISGSRTLVKLCSLSRESFDLYQQILSLQKSDWSGPSCSWHPGRRLGLRPWSNEPLKEHWKGPYQAHFTTDTAEKLWNHHSGLKRNTGPGKWEATSSGPRGLKKLKSNYINCAWEKVLSYTELECPQGVVAIPTAVIELHRPGLPRQCQLSNLL